VFIDRNSSPQKSRERLTRRLSRGCSDRVVLGPQRACEEPQSGECWTFDNCTQHGTHSRQTAYTYHRNHSNTHTQLYYGPLCGTTRVSQCQKKNFFWTLWCREDNTGRHTYNPAGCHSVRTNQRPTSIIPIFTPDALPAASLPIYPGLR